MQERERARGFGRYLPAMAGMVVFGGFLVLGWGFREASTVLRLRRRGLLAQGRVVQNVRRTARSGEPSWIPVIAFTDAAGHHVEFTPQATGTGLGLSTGRTVEVIYLPENSQDARVNSRGHLLAPPLAAAFSGLAFLAIAVAIILVPLTAR